MIARRRRKTGLKAPVSDEAPILHCAGRKIWNSYQIQLRQWIWDAKQFFILRQDFCSDLQGRLQAVLPTQARQNNQLLELAVWSSTLTFLPSRDHVYSCGLSLQLCERRARKCMETAGKSFALQICNL